MYIASGISCKRFFLVVFAVFCACIHLKLRMLISNSNFPINLSCPFCKEPSSSARCTDPSHVLFFEVTTQSNVLYYMTYERIDFSSLFSKKRAQTRLHQIKISDCVLRAYFHLHSLSRYFFHISTKQFSNCKYCQEHWIIPFVWPFVNQIVRLINNRNEGENMFNCAINAILTPFLLIECELSMPLHCIDWKPQSSISFHSFTTFYLTDVKIQCPKYLPLRNDEERGVKNDNLPLFSVVNRKYRFEPYALA